MYTEFIIIYVLLAVAIAIGAVNLVLTLKSRKQDDFKTFGNFNSKPSSNPLSNANPAAENSKPDFQIENNTGANPGVVFCRKCAHQFPASEKFCPYCGTPRN